jgi:hypothetical protein
MSWLQTWKANWLFTWAQQPQVPQQIGSSISGGTFSRGRWHKLKEMLKRNEIDRGGGGGCRGCRGPNVVVVDVVPRLFLAFRRHDVSEGAALHFVTFQLCGYGTHMLVL